MGLKTRRHGGERLLVGRKGSVTAGGKHGGKTEGETTSGEEE